MTLTHELTPAEAGRTSRSTSASGTGHVDAERGDRGRGRRGARRCPASEVRPGRGMSTRRFTLRRRSSPAGSAVLRLTVSELRPRGPRRGAPRRGRPGRPHASPPRARLRLPRPCGVPRGRPPPARADALGHRRTDGRLTAPRGRPAGVPASASEVSCGSRPGGAIERSLATPADGWEDTHVDLAAFGGRLVA